MNIPNVRRIGNTFDAYNGYEKSRNVQNMHIKFLSREPRIERSLDTILIFTFTNQASSSGINKNKGFHITNLNIITDYLSWTSFFPSSPL